MAKVSQFLELKVEDTFEPLVQFFPFLTIYPEAPDAKYLGRGSGIYTFKHIYCIIFKKYFLRTIA